jgi:AcrR family transcriptional regulator
MASGTAERVLVAASTLFLRDGYPATTVVAIASRARVSTGTVLLHHGSKGALAATVLTAALRDVVTAAADELDDDAPTLDRVTGAGARLHRWWSEHDDVAPGLLAASLLEPGHAAVVSRTVLLFARILEVDRRQGRLPDDADVRLLAEGLAADHQHVLLQALRGVRPDLDDQVARFRALASTRLPG